ncbi:adenylyl cyclase alpha, putative [Plasmodium gallinaceum]|uniref:Adenylyl cyclase alpha, putative n=1 Tax=Plasmodium gallinaceum TaxID=5849 RepID=A0A1J1GSZ9_PLAGA|nr:adenylyl cyclase alpha, putative [Plasmodium gallinaceum]CRG95566.1 adenylyl cyclase alpha, putative [Plasmodium gallinaceum]
MIPDLKEIYAKEIFGNKKLRRFFLKYKSKGKVLYSFTSNKETINEEKKNDNLYILKYNSIYFKVLKNKFYKISTFLYLFFVIFSKDILYILLNKKYDGISDFFIIILIFFCFTDIIVNLLTDTNYLFYFMFFDILSLTLLFFDISIYEKYLFDFFCFSIKSLYGIKEIDKEEIFYLVHLFKVLRVVKIYRLIIHFIKKLTKDIYKHRNKWNFEKVESMQNITNLKGSLKFTNKMHLALIKRYFMSLLFIMLSYIFIEIISISKEKKNSMSYFIYNLDLSISKEKKNSMSYFIYNLDLIIYDDYYENEFLKALYFYSQKKKRDVEYLISFKSKKKLKNFINKKEINLKEKNFILWDFTNLSYVIILNKKNDLIKFLNMNSTNHDKNVEVEIILDNTIKDINELRYYEVKIYKSKDYTFYINIKKIIENKIKKIIILKIFVIIFSLVILFYFTCELNILLFPIESILKKLKLMKANPILALEMQEELLNHELKHILSNSKLKRKSIKENYEILKMEENLMKLGTLMLLGFGEAGAKIISKNINEQENINLLVNGEIVYSVFAFCDIRNFTEITEILKEKIMIFINLIAEIIHECCDFYGGSINKNIGDAFLLVWKCKKNKYTYEEKKCYNSKNSKIENKDFSEKEDVKRICDLAFLSTIQTLIKLQQSEKINLFLKNEKIDNLVNKNILELSFGLHFGWAIEGAIGSSYKIDLTYLSENVNIASRLQDISKIYKSHIIISGDFYDNMSDNFKKLLRKIDRAKLKGCKNPLNLFTFDLFLNKIKKKTDVYKFNEELNFKVKIQKILDDIKKKTDRRIRKKEILNLNYNIYEEYIKNKDIKSIKVDFPNEYLNVFEDALELYLNGNWNESRKNLEYLKKNYFFEDNIATQLLNFMNLTNFTTPQDWCGYRKFLQKS